MSQAVTIEQALSSLRRFVGRFPASRAVLLDFAAASFEQDNGQAGYAALKHASDILHEQPQIADCELFIETYRRVFFDKAQAAKYGTDDLVPHSPDLCLEMVEVMHRMQDVEDQGSVVMPEAGSASMPL